jgi:hypothetical protein
MKVAIMQPYFFPYLGYFHLIDAVDLLVLTDDYQFTKRGWINRNRILNDGRVQVLTLPLKKSSDFEPINKKIISDDFDHKKFFQKIYNAYHKFPNYNLLSQLLLDANFFAGANFFDVVEMSIKETTKFLKISTKIMRSSDFNLSSNLNGQEKIFEICHKLGANEYVNLSGGRELYSQKDFLLQDISLRFVNSRFAKYSQKSSNFIPQLSILDLIASISLEKEIFSQIQNYSLES